MSLYNTWNLNKHGTKAFYIDEEGRDHEIDLMLVDMFVAMDRYTIKVEGMESAFPMFGGTVHLYHAPKDAPSFDIHTDPYDVKIICIDGIKTLEVAGVEVALQEGEQIMIEADTPHRATNHFASTMISIGYEE